MLDWGEHMCDAASPGQLYVLAQNDHRGWSQVAAVLSAWPSPLFNTFSLNATLPYLIAGLDLAAADNLIQGKRYRRR